MSESTEGSRPKLEQARKSSDIEAEKRLQRRWATIKPLAAVGIAVTGAVGLALGSDHAAKVLNEMNPDNPENQPTHLLKIDTSKYRLQWNKNGDKLNIRSQPKTPTTLGETESGKDNKINIETIEGINGTPWDGHSDVILDKSLIAEGTNPASGIGNSNWFAINVEIKGADEDIWAYINNGSATSAHIQKLEQGEIGDVELRNDGKEFRGILNSGEIIPHMEIGKVEMVSPLPQQS